MPLVALRPAIVTGVHLGMLIPLRAPPDMRGLLMPAPCGLV